MGTRKKGSELVFNLQWRHKPDNGGDKSNIIGMYDTPQTTLNFEMFKSYLLKNSGVAGNDVKVIYITDNGQEWFIDSQEGFEIALSAFRLKARLGEAIFLKLDKISNGRHTIGRKHSNDVETQSEVDSLANTPGTPPEWFLTYMKQFKHDIVEEVTYSLTSNLPSNTQEKEKEAAPITIPNPKKPKPECPKRSRKHLVLGETVIDRDLLKNLKFDRKLENKLDKLDAKTKKIKEKKQALMNRMENVERKISRDEIPAPVVLPEKEPIPEEDTAIITVFNDDNISTVDKDGVPFLNASTENPRSFDRLTGGEVFLRTWEVTNTGKLPWSINTELRLTWGSVNLVPASNIVRCPALKPGETGTIAIRFNVPRVPGTYESCWNFYDIDQRFGNPLSCTIVVEPILAPLPFSEKTESKVEFQKMFSNPILRTEKYRRQSHRLRRRRSSDDDDFMIDVENEMIKSQNSFPRLNRYVEDLRKGSTVLDDDYPPIPPQFMTAPSAPPQSDKSEEIPLVKNIKHAENTVDNTDSVIDLSTRIEGVKIEGNVDTDSDWESVCSYGKKRDDLTTDSKRPSNKYGITENDLIVDLSKNLKENKENNVENVEKEDGKEAAAILNEDDNNNNGSTDNTISGESFSEIASDISSSDLSGYDVIQVCEEKEEDGSGYVYITIDGNKLPVPKHILRPDFLTTAEEAPGPLVSEDERTEKEPLLQNEETCAAEKTQPQENEAKLEDAKSAASPSKVFLCGTPVPREPAEDAISQSACTAAGEPTKDMNDEDLKSFNTHCSTTGSCFSDTTHGRLFIFPENHPGFEVFRSNRTSPLSSIDSTNKKPSEGSYDRERPAHTSNGNSSTNGSPWYFLNDNTFVGHLGRPECYPAPYLPPKEMWHPRAPPAPTFSPPGCLRPNPGQYYSREGYREAPSMPPPSNYQQFAAAPPSTIDYRLNMMTSPQNYQQHAGYRRGVTVVTPNYQQPAATPSPTYQHPTATPSPNYQHPTATPSPNYQHPTATQSPNYQHPTAASLLNYRLNMMTSPQNYQQPAAPLPPNYEQSAAPLPPNYQQPTTAPQPKASTPTTTPAPPSQQQTPPERVAVSGVHILPENLVNGAVNAATSAINTARSVINMIAQPKKDDMPEGWVKVNGYWVPESAESLRATNLCILAEMGFLNTDVNLQLLKRFDDDIERVISELLR